MSGTLSVSGGVSVSVAATGARYESATLSVKDGSEPPLRCQFNPTEYSISTSATWRRYQAPGAPATAVPQFVSTNPASLALDLFFDSRNDGAPPVADAVTRLLSWTRPTQRSVSDNRPSPPVVTFEWGGTASFDAYVSSATARFVLFRRDGTPIRAHVSLRLEEIPAPLPGTNPTSGSEVLVRQRRLVAGETLSLVAWQEYGSADAWRLIARASGIDDPSRVAPGTLLVVPERSGPGRPA